MNKGVEILLARMETNPEEFENTGRWIDLYNHYKKFMAEEEQEMFMTKLKALKMEQFEQEVVKRLLREENKERSGRAMTTTDIISHRLSALGDSFTYKWATVPDWEDHADDTNEEEEK